MQRNLNLVLSNRDSFNRFVEMNIGFKIRLYFVAFDTQKKSSYMNHLQLNA